MLTYEEFKTKYLGTWLGKDKMSRQCVFLIRKYIEEVLGTKQPPTVIGAKNLWEVEWSEEYEKIPNEIDTVPEQGWIVIFNSTFGNVYGHVGIVESATKTDLFIMEQNNPTGAKCRISTRFNYINPKVLGFIRKKKKEQNSLWNKIRNLF